MTTITEPGRDASPDEKVTFGAAELDRLQPGWYKLIDLDVLDLQNDEKCILGQLNETFDDGLEHFHWTDEDAEIRGFYVAWTDDDNDHASIRTRIIYMDLTDFWCQEINARLRTDEEAH